MLSEKILNGWFEVEISDQMLEKAKSQAKELGELKHSIRKGEGNLVGFVGEMAVRRITGAIGAGSYQHDMTAPNGKRLEVKSKEVTSMPFSHYECSICDWNPKQQADCYVFVRVLSDYSVAWVLGTASRIHYFSNATHHRKGQFDPRNKFTFKADCWNLAISNLQPLTNYCEIVANSCKIVSVREKIAFSPKRGKSLLKRLPSGMILDSDDEIDTSNDSIKTCWKKLRVKKKFTAMGFDFSDSD